MPDLVLEPQPDPTPEFGEYNNALVEHSRPLIDRCYRESLPRLGTTDVCVLVLDCSYRPAWELARTIFAAQGQQDRLFEARARHEAQNAPLIVVNAFKRPAVLEMLERIGRTLHLRGTQGFRALKEKCRRGFVWVCALSNHGRMLAEYEAPRLSAYSADQRVTLEQALDQWDRLMGRNGKG